MASQLTHPLISDGWFMEKNSQWPGQAMSLKVEEILHVEQSKFQDVLVFRSSNYGNVLVLDGAIQVTERDEFSYQEMITHLAMNSHPCPKKVLVIGGGDGGVLREVVKHACVEKATLVDIDEAVPRVSKKYLSQLAVGLEHPKCEVIIGDGIAYLEDKVNEYDVIITDSSDPDGPAAGLFGHAFFALLKNALTEKGVFSTQGECMWLHLKLIKEVQDACKELFPKVEYAYTSIPTYPSGQIGHIICSKDENANLKKPLRSFTKEQEDELLRYYNSEIHEAAFVLPQFARKALSAKSAVPQQ